MPTLFWVLAIYLLTVAISFPFIRRYALNHAEKCEPYNPMFVAWVGAWMPILNIYYTFKIVLGLIALRLMARSLKRKFKDHPDPHVRETIKSVVDHLTGMSNPNNKE